MLPGQWWTLFGSQELDALISAGPEAVSGHRRSAGGAACGARKCARPSRACLRRRCRARRIRNARRSAAPRSRPGFPSFITSLYQANVNVSYTFDVFGGERRTLEGLRAQAENQTYQLEASVLTLTSNVAASAIGLAATREQIEVTHQIIAVEEQQLHMIERQYRVGRTHARRCIAAAIEPGLGARDAAGAATAIGELRARARGADRAVSA